MIWPNWDRELLGALGMPATPTRLRFLDAWAACEGGTAKYNPLNTTQLVPRAWTYNEAGVKHYPDALSGLAATLLTLSLPYYRDIRRALLTGETPCAVARLSRRGLATWGTGHSCIEARLGCS